MPDDDHASYSLACPFLDPDPKFAYGVAFGLLWARMRDPKCRRIREYVMSEIEEQVRVGASRAGWEVRKLRPWVEDGEHKGWVYVELVRRK